MALTATIYTLAIELSDVDRGVYESLDLRVAWQPSESAEFMTVRILAYCLEYSEGISLSQGVAAGDEPAIWVRDLTGKPLAWIEVGLPDAEKLHRGSRLAERVAVYTHRDPEQFLAQLAGKKIHHGRRDRRLCPGSPLRRAACSADRAAYGVNRDRDGRGNLRGCRQPNPEYDIG